MKNGIIKKDKMYLVKQVYVGWDLVPANSKKEAKKIISSDSNSYIKEIYDNGEVNKHYLNYEDVGWIKIKVKKMMSKFHRAIQKQLKKNGQLQNELPTSYQVTKEIGAWVSIKHSVVGEVDIEGSNELNKYPIDTTNIN